MKRKPAPKSPRLCQHPDGRYYVRLQGRFHYLGRDPEDALRRYHATLAETAATGLPAPEADAGWLRVGEAAERAGVKACAISQAVKRGLLESNGKKGTRRRICPKSFEGYLHRRGRKHDESYYL